MVLFIARHCETILNQQNRIQGSRFDHQLTNKGILQAKIMGHKIHNLIHGHKIDVVYTSNSKRAMETAKNVYPDADIIVDERLNAFDVGTADGLKYSELKSFKNFPIPLFYKEMENFLKYIKRTKEALTDIMLENKDKVVLVVTHRDVTAIIEKFMTGASYINTPKLGVGNGEFRMYHVLEHDKDLISKGKFADIKMVKHDSKDLSTPLLQGEEIKPAYQK